ncbi:DNA polymerase III subunit alpha, putative [Babesia ovata]|uniref:DNA polymerase III subunit alpha, putative n=1 Tax=Babesia ovata TaxID=189622 RepID=A0A2H6KEI0_9APIC|nr:DNA polymerase III subunit alpha, putative [Babesia ovata]GBE61395.1 DNA polymerase III subunit alpha, putative [Babesia ovata]
MFDLVFGILDVRQGVRRAHRILTVGDEPGACASFAELLSRVYDLRTLLVEVDGASPPGEGETPRQCAVQKDDPYVARVPLECMFAEIRRRNWYRGAILDFFTPPESVNFLDAATDTTLISGVHVIVYVTSYAKYRTGFRAAVGFFRTNRDCAAFKFLVVDVSSAQNVPYVDAEAELMRFIESEPEVSVYKVDLDDELRRGFLSRSILDEAVMCINMYGVN